MASEGKAPVVVIPEETGWPESVAKRARNNIKSYESCVQALLEPFLADFNIYDPWVIRAGGALHGGGLSSLTCGVHTAGLMILGLVVGRQDITQGMDGLLPAVMPAQDLVKQLTALLGSSSCRELTGVDFTDLGQALAFLVSPGHDTCITRVENGARAIASFLQEQQAAGLLFRHEPGA
ncbi:MAG: C-GCAxxG-C-C family protein [Thermodesulfobacteriota bacterium]